jgi:hypothetical protein
MLEDSLASGFGSGARIQRHSGRCCTKSEAKRARESTRARRRRSLAWHDRPRVLGALDDRSPVRAAKQSTDICRIYGHRDKGRALDRIVAAYATHAENRLRRAGSSSCALHTSPQESLF